MQEAGKRSLRDAIAVHAELQLDLLHAEALKSSPVETGHRNLSCPHADLAECWRIEFHDSAQR